MFLTKNLHPKKSVVWATLNGPIFAEKNVDGSVYWKILNKEALTQFTAMKKFSKFCFQQDGAKAHTFDLTLDLVETHFKKRVISNRFSLKKRGLELVVVQPQFQSFGLFPLGYVKNQCYANRPTMISALQKNITDIFGSLREDVGIF